MGSLVKGMNLGTVLALLFSIVVLAGCSSQPTDAPPASPAYKDTTEQRHEAGASPPTSASTSQGSEQRSGDSSTTATVAAEVKRLIVLDPGHGGKEIGAKGVVSGITEKEINLKVGLRVKEELLQRGYEVIMTRETDEQFVPGDFKVDLNARIAMAVEKKADVYISIHVDQFPKDHSIHGTKVYYWTEQSETLAELMHESLTQALESKPLGVHRNDFIVLRESQIPSILIELGFLTNAKEEQKLITEGYQEKAIEAIVAAVEVYMHEHLE